MCFYNILIFCVCVFYRLVLVESIPVGVEFNSSVGHPSIYQSWLSLLSEAQSSLDIASFYWSLTNEDTHTHEPTANQARILWERCTIMKSEIVTCLLSVSLLVFLPVYLSAFVFFFIYLSVFFLYLFFCLFLCLYFHLSSRIIHYD